MKVFHCITDMRTGGAQRQLLYLAAEQARQGDEVHLAYLHDGPNSVRLVDSRAVIHRLRSWGNHDPRLIWQLVQLVRRHRADIVQTWINQMDVFGGIAARLLGVPWVLSERCSALNYPPTWKNRLRARLGAGADAIVSNSQGGNAYWQPLVGRSTRRHVIPNALPLDEIAGAAPVELPAGAVPAGARVAVHVGRLCPQKNLANLIAALKLVSARLPLVTFLCGDGTHVEETRELIARHDLADRVVLTGYRADAWSWMKRADVFLSASLFEGHPNAVLEAAACGCPLVLSDIPAHREMLDERAAFLVQPLVPADVAAGILRCLTDPAEAAGRAEQARACVQRLSIPEMAGRYRQVYLALTAGGTAALPLPQTARLGSSDPV